MPNQKTDCAGSYRLQLERHGFALLKTSGISMRPLIWTGQHYVAVAPLVAEPAVGDILVFEQTLCDGNVRNVVHRLVEIRSEGDRHIYVTRGDNCIGHELVRRSEIIGRVTEVHRIGGYRPWHAIPAKCFSMTDRAYLRYSHMWAAIWPVRRVFMLLRARVYSLYGRVRSIF